MRNTTLIALAFSTSLACGGPPSAHSPVDGPPTPAPPAPIPVAPGPPLVPSPESALFAAHLARNGDMTYEQLRGRIEQRTYRTALTFDPTSARYFETVANALQLTPREIATFKKLGMVSVDHRQRYSMGSAYYAIYAKDLPVLVTTDSILHALHRSYDKVLESLELTILVPTLQQALASAHAALAAELSSAKDPALSQSLRDIDLYFTVARRLIPSDDSAAAAVKSLAGQEDQVNRILSLIAAKNLTPVQLYGGTRTVDFSQFEPRGHYADVPLLQAYFRAMMWLGRADLGWFVMPPSPQSGIQVDVNRERLDAAVMTRLLASSGALTSLERMNDIVSFMVGQSDDLTPFALVGVLDKVGARTVSDLADPAVVERLRAAIETSGLGAQQIRSQFLESPVNNTVKTPPPALFQTFGQRFLLDSFILSQVVYDAIVFHGEKQKRMMPSGLDVMAALGNDAAVSLLEPALRQHKYAANLLAARAVVDGYRPERWNATLYNLWLDGIRTLDDAPEGGAVPEVMATHPWQLKQLQAQLASWAELRHDTLLYGKQSYSAYPACAYPEGFVEPYPAFYARLASLGDRAVTLLSALPLDVGQAAELRDKHVAFFKSFSVTLRQLEALARKELASQPFSDEEAAFLKKVVDIRGGGSGPPRYDGWFPKLIYGGQPAEWKPTIADVHTDPESRKALEVGVGDAQFLVVAVDNDGDRAVYVGPAYTYYELSQPISDRLTDAKWAELLSGTAHPARPSWTSPFLGDTVARRLGP